LPEGCAVAIVGENGSGKSTLLQLVNAVQGAGLFPHLTARDNIILLAKPMRLDRDVIE